MGKSLQPVNAIAVRQPANTPPAAPSAAPTPAPAEPVTAESLGWQLRAALPPMRLHSVSLYDDEANVLWLSEGALGPDEHNVVIEAIDALGNDTTLNCYESGLEDGRAAIFLPVRSPQGALVGLAMILADMKSVNDGVIEKLVTPQMRTIMQKVAVLLKKAPVSATQGELPVPILELAETSVTPALRIAPEPTPAPSSAPSLSLAPSPARTAAAASEAAKPASSSPGVAPPAKPGPVLSPKAVDDILEFELTPEVPRVQAQRPAKPSPANDSDLRLGLTSDTSTSAPAVPVLSGIEATAAASKPAAAAPTVFAANVAPFPAGGSASTHGAKGKAAPAAPVDAAPAVVDELAPPISTLAAAPIVVASTPAPAPGSISRAAHSTALNGSHPPVALDGSHAAPAPSGSVSAAKVNGSAAGAANPTPAGPAATSTSRTLGGTTGSAKALNPGATSTSRVLTLPEGVTITLEIQPFSKLRAGGRTRRYEVLARASHPNRVPAGFDKIALQQLLTWMGGNRAAWNAEPTSFTLNLSIATLEDERFPQFVASNLKTHGIAPDNVGFEIAEPLCLQRRAQVERFITLCDNLGCFVVIDDFSLDSSLVSLLRSKALRLVKIDPKLTSVALKDKLAQAMVVAIAQAVKVLGIHCAAKRVDSQAALQWLTAIGCDFAQGTVVSETQPLESLCSPPG